jgi:hypothetical protein
MSSLYPNSGGGDAFTIVQPTSGTSPTALSPDSTLKFTSSDSSVTITGNSTTNTVNFQAAGAGANVYLSNLSATSINQSLIPSADATYSLGTSASTGRWLNGYFSGSVYSGLSPSASTGAGFISLNPGGTGSYNCELHMGIGAAGYNLYLNFDGSGLNIRNSSGYTFCSFDLNFFNFYINNVTAFAMDANCNFAIGQGPLATTATNGFVYTPTGAGAPTGVPTTKTGLAPMYIDTTNNKLWVYINSAWKGVVVS